MSFELRARKWQLDRSQKESHDWDNWSFLSMFGMAWIVESISQQTSVVLGFLQGF